MTASEAKLLTYAEAGARVGRGVKFIRKAVKDGRLIATDLGRKCKRISEFDFLKYLENSRTLERRPR